MSNCREGNLSHPTIAAILHLFPFANDIYFFQHSRPLVNCKDVFSQDRFQRDQLFFSEFFCFKIP